MLQKVNEVNSLEKFIKENNLTAERTSWEKVTDESALEFPQLDMQELQALTFGEYQVL